MKREAVRAPLAVQPITRDVLQEKYLKEGEQDVDELFARVAAALASVEAQGRRAAWQAKFHANLRRGAIGAGRIMSAAGTGLHATLINCFVQPVGDCIQGVDAGRLSRHLRGAARSGRDHAPRRRRRLRLLAHPPARGRSQRHGVASPPARAATSTCSTTPAPPWKAPARAAARRWACCASTTRT